VVRVAFRISATASWKRLAASAELFQLKALERKRYVKAQEWEELAPRNDSSDLFGVVPEFETRD
jgi:hypothetical protein